VALKFCRGNAGTIGDRCLMIVDNILRIKGVVRECQGTAQRRR
jgi:hypothetical protein